MNGITHQGNVFKGKMPAEPSVESVPSAKDIDGMTHQGFKNTVKSSQTAGFSASRKCGTIKGNSYR